MTRATTTDQINAAITELANTHGRPPAALAVARHLNIPYTTFRRRYPHILTQLDASRASTAVDRQPTRLATLQTENAALKEQRQSLNDHLEIAVANIRRLSIENNQLRAALEQATNIPHLPTARPTE